MRPPWQGWIGVLMVLLAMSAAPAQESSSAPAGGVEQAGETAEDAASAAEAAADALAAQWQTRLREAVDSTSLPDLIADLEQSVREQIALGEKLNDTALVRLATYRQFAAYFGRLTELSEHDRQALKWLIDQPVLMTTLMMAVDDSADAPDRVLQVLGHLQRESPRRAGRYPELTTALCVVWDEHDPESQLDADVLVPEEILRRVVDLLGYYVVAGSDLQFDVRTMPHDLSVFVVDSRASQAELIWAARRYRKHAAIGRTYFDVAYDTGFTAGMPKRIDNVAYTLPNLLQWGGICIDQAYYATQVSKAVGVPSVVCEGAGSEGGGFHAWVGYLQRVGKDVGWNFNEGRYEAHQYWWAQVKHPQTHEVMYDADIALSMEAATTPWQRRMLSMALTRSADLLETPDALRVLSSAIQACPGNRRAWLALADMGAQRRLDDAQILRVMEVVDRFATQRYPEFAWSTMVHLVSGRGNTERVAALEKLIPLFKHRPDLQARTRLAQGDVLAAAQPKEALACYLDVLEKSRIAPIIMFAMQRIDNLLRDHNELGRLMRIYHAVWTNMPPPRASSLAVRGSPWGIVGERYMMLAMEVGDFQTVETIRRRLEAVTPTASR